MRSPKLAAMGVATLSGLMPVFFEPTITPTMMIPECDTSRVEHLTNTHHITAGFQTLLLKYTHKGHKISSSHQPNAGKIYMWLVDSLHSQAKNGNLMSDFQNLNIH